MMEASYWAKGFVVVFYFGLFVFAFCFLFVCYLLICSLADWLVFIFGGKGQVRGRCSVNRYWNQLENYLMAEKKRHGNSSV